MGSTPDHTQLPFWQVNIAPDDREDECPPYLRNLSAKDIEIIGTRDEDYHVKTWDEVVTIVQSRRLQYFQRRPSDLRRYRAFVWRLTRKWGSVTEYLLRERLHWEAPIVPRSCRPFACREDFRIMFNDWPYGIDRRIVHLVAWTKFQLPDDAETEAEIDSFIERTFLTEIAKEQLIWFKNPPVLKSVHALEHIHIMLLDPDPAFVRTLTNGDMPRSQLSRGKECRS